jgi:hypothetical protein
MARDVFRQWPSPKQHPVKRADYRMKSVYCTFTEHHQHGIHSTQMSKDSKPDAERQTSVLWHVQQWPAPYAACACMRASCATLSEAQEVQAVWEACERADSNTAIASPPDSHITVEAHQPFVRACATFIEQRKRVHKFLSNGTYFLH